MKSTKPMAHIWRASRYVYVDCFLCTFVYISFYDLVLEETQIGDRLSPQGTCIFFDIGIYIYIYIMHPDSEQVVQEEHPIRVVVSEAPWPTISYSRTVSKNVILVLEFEQMYIEFLKVGKLTYKNWFFCSLHWCDLSLLFKDGDHQWVVEKES